MFRFSYVKYEILCKYNLVAFSFTLQIKNVIVIKQNDKVCVNTYTIVLSFYAALFGMYAKIHIYIYICRRRYILGNGSHLVLHSTFIHANLFGNINFHD